MLAVAICNIWAQAESGLSLSGGHFYPPTPLWGSLWEPDEDGHPAADDYLGLEEGAWSIKQGIRPVDVPRSSGRVSLSWGGNPWLGWRQLCKLVVVHAYFTWCCRSADTLELASAPLIREPSVL